MITDSDGKEIIRHSFNFHIRTKETKDESKETECSFIDKRKMRLIKILKMVII